MKPLGHDPTWRNDGFSLLEMIGVLAVIAVLVAALLPAWIKRIDLAVRKAEVNNLVTVSNALTHQILRGTRLHSSTSWATPVATWAMLPTSKVTANARRYSRVYFTQAGAEPGPGYSQDWQGFATRPKDLRAVVVSVLGGDALDASNSPEPAGGALSPADFDPLWNAADNARPTGGGWNWNGRGDDFMVQRVDYAPLFHHLVLLNRETNVAPTFTINGPGAHPIPRIPNAHNPGWDAYYLEGTVVGLCDPEGRPMTRYVLQQDISFVWEAGKWRAEILGAPDSDNLGDDFAQKAKEFLEAVRYQDAFKGANQQGVVTAMYDFMFTYVFWANECPLFNTHGVSGEQVAEYRILKWIGKNDNSGQLFQFSSYLIR